MGLFSALKDIFGDPTPKTTNSQPGQGPIVNLQRPEGLALGVGVSSGVLHGMGHPQGLITNQFVWLANDDACQNIVVFGGIGAGKTTRVINPLLFQLLGYNDVGGLIFDIKGDFCESVDAVAKWQRREYVKIGVGPGCVGINLLKGLTPEQAAGFLQSTFYLTGGATQESFWVQSAVALIQNTLGLLEALGDKYYNLEKLYQYIFYEDVRKAIDMMIDDEVHYEDGTLEARNLANYKGYYSSVFLQMDIKMRESIKATLSTILSPFQNPELIDAFSGTNDDENYNLLNILSGSVVLVDLPLAKWATAGKVVYTMIKLRFFNLLQERQMDKTKPQNFVFFMCDEYQNIISASKDGLSDLSFWDKSRSAHCVGIISTQSISAFKSAIGNPTLSDTILANFRQKIFFKTEDSETLRYINSLAGRVEVTRQSYSRTSGANQQPGHFFGSTNNSSTYNTQIVERQLIDPNFMRQLAGNLALCFLNVEGSSADDVLIFRPLYPNDIKSFLGQ
jgi:type IV secretory pathway TraG/TraD family ATPase VirD4